MIDLLPSGQPPPADVDSASPALLRRRALATVLDVLVSYFVLTTAALAVIIGVFPAETEARGSLLFVGSFALVVPLYLTYCFALEWRYGQTIGKVSQGLVVVTPTGNRPDVLACAVRNILRYVDFLPVGYLLGWYLARQSPTGQRLGDRLGNTVVAEVAPMDEIEADATEPRGGE
jgi:uncharacterized RDD family membrane protein YckC